MRKAALVIGLFILQATSPSFAVEQVDLTTPYDPDSRSTSYFKVKHIRYDAANKRFLIVLIGANNIELPFGYSGDGAVAFHNLLNRPHAARSRDWRALNKLIADGKLSGSISGSPD